MLTSTTPLNRPLGGGLVMKSVADERDVERYTAFDVQIFGQGVAGFTSALILHHPATRPEYCLYIEDETTRQIVSTVILIPWEWRYEDVTLKAGEVGVVGTLESYRNRGLVRALMARHHELLDEGDFNLSHIQGIPYFYRQFGYEYAIPLNKQWYLEHRSLPDKPAESAYHFRLATAQDIPLLMRFYNEAALSLDVSALRGQAVWDYLLGPGIPTDTGAEVWLALDASDQPVAYFRVPSHGFGAGGLIVDETSRMNNEVAAAVLLHLKALAQNQSKLHLCLNLPDSNDLVRAAQAFQVHNGESYGWQIHLVDVARLLHKLTPVLERRIAASIFAGMTRTICLNLYREAFELRFEAGKLQAVEAVGFRNSGNIRLPPLLLAPLLLGSKSWAELRGMYPDAIVEPGSEHLIDVLFPKLDSFIYATY